MSDFPPLSPHQSPVDHLQAIRELTEKNEQILARMLEIEEKRESRRKWKILGSFFMIIFPYLLMALASWYFYMQITSRIDQLETTVKSIIPEIPESWSQKAEDLKDKISNTDWQFWGEENAQ